ncbi:MAG: hypothetical protein ACRDK2_10220 [Solirubrobacteraceae bacterium]
MRRTLPIALGALALALIVPSSALAHHGHSHHHNFRAHHAKFRLVHLGSMGSPTSTPSTTPSTPSTPPPENAGTVASYSGGVLTLTLNSGSNVSGTVTNDTRIGCIPSQPTTGQPQNQGPGDDNEPGDQGSGDDNGHGDDQGDDDANQQQGNDGSDNGNNDNWGHDHEPGGVGNSEPPCDSSALKAGATVRFAELRLTPTGNEFESVWLVVM